MRARSLWSWVPGAGQRVPSSRALLVPRRAAAMPEFLADPSVLTKEKLKSELIANNVSLPGGEQRKDVYVQLYLQHLTARNPPAVAQPDFSSDEEREPTTIGARGRGAAVGRVSAAAPPSRGPLSAFPPGRGSGPAWGAAPPPARPAPGRPRRARLKRGPRQTAPRGRL